MRVKCTKLLMVLVTIMSLASCSSTHYLSSPSKISLNGLSHGDRVRQLINQQNANLPSSPAVTVGYDDEGRLVTK